ncbi:MAG TPA: phosphatase PAP2 family protein [Planctomycetota bacterium]|nr:phosphatase PAP2 family protein [Planctomycetota bacterium]
MLSNFASIDTYLLTKINGTWYHPALDPFFRLVSNFEKLGWVGAVPILSIAIFCGNRWRYALLLALLAVGGADLSATALKEIVHRPRAYETETIRKVEKYRYTSKSGGFPSNHAANTMAAMTIVAWHFRKKKWAAALCMCVPALVGYSRVYLGVHYPSDVLAGFAIGGAVAASILLLHYFAPVISFEPGRERRFSWRGLIYLFLFFAVIYLCALAARTSHHPVPTRGSTASPSFPANSVFL